ncbi:DUF4870 domain-containing protein [Staphylococcus sp. 11511212]|uniref:DUF4870 domain-containing protein n=1 Tax=Staphylococcus sp. 11511212 TaxID=2714544 RepID=UPI001403152D|nr:DUF4870 domain-containing protein [Staphylococcus sp. 11511212]NHM77180.1 DUF4870 domain-containing protein [Staphylococcus sp. 11511212]
MSNSSDKLLASLCYFSVFFAPILFPIVVWILTKYPVTTHAKKSIIYHILPWISMTLAAIFFGLSQSTPNIPLYFTLGIILLVMAFLTYVYNLYCGVKVLITKEL